MAHMSGFFDSREGIEEGAIVDAIAVEIIDGEIAHAKRGEVLEKVSALRRINAIVSQAGFDNDACSRDVWPFHRNSQPRIARSPSTRPYQDVVLAFVEEFGIDARNFFCN